MLINFLIQNYAIIDRLEFQPQDGFTCITGETGAGKSILLGALGLVMGKRADSKILYHPDRKCLVEAVFKIEEYQLIALFESLELDYSEETILRREILPNGKSRAFVNDSPVTLDTLKSISAHLLDLHQQFDTQGILDPSFQLDFVDKMASTHAELEIYVHHFKKWEQLQRKWSKIKVKIEEYAKEQDYNEFLLEELIQLNIQQDEIQSLEMERNTLYYAEEISQSILLSLQKIHEEDHSLENQIRFINQNLSKSKLRHPSIEQFLVQLSKIEEELMDFSQNISKFESQLESNPQKLSKVDARLHQIYTLLKKHKLNSEQELISLQETLEQKTNRLSQLESLEIETKNLIDHCQSELERVSDVLHKKRISIIPEIESRMKDLLAMLSIPNGSIRIELIPLSEFQLNGKDQIKIWFSANKGSRPDELKNIASGGELSRIALCLKSLVADKMVLPTLLFDEIDQGVSGEVAHQMGKIMRNLADKHQVICITHSAQIAAKGKKHFYIYKDHSGEKTQTKLKLLEQEERANEIATMLSGQNPSASALANALELLEQ